MLFPNYIKKDHIFVFIIIEILLSSFGFTLLAKFFFVGFALLLYLFRLGPTIDQQGLHETDSSCGICAPACGKIIDVSVRGPETHILLQIPWHLSYAIRAPIAGEVEDFKIFSVGSDIFRFSKVENFYRESIPRSVAIRFLVGHHGLHSVSESCSASSQDRITVKLIKCFFGFFPDFWIRQGDRCHRKAVIGLIPFGGTVSLSLPSNYEIITKVGDIVTAGTTRLANIK